MNDVTVYECFIKTCKIYDYFIFGIFFIGPRMSRDNLKKERRKIMMKPSYVLCIKSVIFLHIFLHMYLFNMKIMIMNVIIFVKHNLFVAKMMKWEVLYIRPQKQRSCDKWCSIKTPVGQWLQVPSIGLRRQWSRICLSETFRKGHKTVIKQIMNQ